MDVQNKVVHLSLVREMLMDLEQVRQAVRGANVRGFSLTVMNDDGTEQVFMGGAYKADSHAAVRAILRMSAARMLTEDCPLPPPKE